MGHRERAALEMYKRTVTSVSTFKCAVLVRFCTGTEPIDYTSV